MPRIIKYLLISILVGFSSCFGYSEIIQLPNQTVNITTPIVLTNSHTTLLGQENTLLKLSENANCPVIIVGNLVSQAVSDIHIENIKIDGNKQLQTSEHWLFTSNGLVNNNGIVIQNANNITISNVIIKNCKSGGLVTTFHVSNLTVDNLESAENEFDGFAGYETKNSVFLNLSLHDNKAAGISLDNHFNNNLFFNCLIFNNNSVVFMRNSSGNVFSSIFALENQKGIFIAQVNNFPNTSCSNNMFKNIKIDNIKPFIINDKSCVNNILFKNLQN